MRARAKKNTKNMSLFLTVAVASSVGAVGGCSWSALSVFYNVKLLDNTVAPADSPTAAAALAGGAKLYAINLHGC